MHPSNAIRGKRSELLAGRRIVIGVTGSISAVEVVRVIRELIRHGADVRAVMSPDAARIITAEALQFATGHEVVTALTGNVEHVSFLSPGPDRADLLLVAPATANSISKIAHGIDDTPVTSFASVALGNGVPVIVAPAMNEGMGRNPAVMENLDRLKRWGVGVVTPVSAEGEEKLASPEEVAAAVLQRLAKGVWVGRQVLIIGGASRESIDDVRSITNESSGETAVQIAAQSHFRGANAELWMGSSLVPIPSFLRVERWRGVEDLVALLSRRREYLDSVSAVWVPAALSDYTLKAQPGKISSRANPTLDLHLSPAPKALGQIRKLAPPPSVLVAFKLEAGSNPSDLEKSARNLVEETGADWVVANSPSAAGAVDTDWLVVQSDRQALGIRGTKSTLAGRLLDEVGRSLPPPSSSSR